LPKLVVTTKVVTTLPVLSGSIRENHKSHPGHNLPGMAFVPDGDQAAGVYGMAERSTFFRGKTSTSSYSRLPRPYFSANSVVL